MSSHTASGLPLAGEDGAVRSRVQLKEAGGSYGPQRGERGNMVLTQLMRLHVPECI